MAARRKSDDPPFIYEYVTAIQRLGFHIVFDQDMLTDTPDRLAQYVHTVFMFKDGELVHHDSGLNIKKLLHEALIRARYGSLE
jgi:hypothetical protein